MALVAGIQFASVDVSLYRLNISGLAISTVMIALFFMVLRRSIRRSEMRWWTYGWLANVAALAATTAFWYGQPPLSTHGVVFAAYMVCKAGYVWFLLRGALEFRSWRPMAIPARVAIPAVLVLFVASALLLTTRDRLGVAASVVIAAGFGTGAIALFNSHAASATWIAIGFGVRSFHAAIEAVAYTVAVATEQTDSAFLVPANAVLAAHYSLGTAVEWLLAMGCLIGVAERAQHELQAANAQMLAAQADLRRIADRDPLTGLANRRALADVFRAVQPEGATLIFLDLDGFKKINDEHGHQAGDACLARFAAALTHCFRPTDAVVRYAGDEFLVVAPGVGEAAVADRIDAVRRRLADPGELPVRFSYGVGLLAAGGNADEALRAADEAMYRSKPASHRKRLGTELTFRPSDS